MRFITLRGALALLVTATAAACDHSSAIYPPTAPPDPPPPPAASFPAGLWTVSGASSEIDGLDNSQLLTSGLKTPATTLFTSSVSLSTLNSIAFDANGTMWIGSREDSVLAAFVSDNKPGFTTPAIIIESNARSLAGISGLAFDIDQSLWVANSQAGTIVRFDKTQLTASGSPVPSVTITGIGHPTSLAFDATGALWITDILANTVSRYLRGQLLSSGDKQPAIVLSTTGSSLVNPTGIAFDSFNNMWIANIGEQSVVAFRPPQRASSGAPVPFLTLSPTEKPLNNPTGLAFDQDGSLWVIGVWGLLSKFTAPGIAASGPAEPALQMTIDDSLLAWNIAFWPKPSGFPLN